MLTRPTRGGAHLALIDTPKPENMAMVSALLARSPVHASQRVTEIHDKERADALAAVATLGPGLDAATKEALVDAVLAVGRSADAGARARRIGDQFYVGYGHKSIGDNGSFTLYAGNISMLAAKAIEQSPLFNGQELSTRAVDMAKQPVLDPIGSSATRSIQERWIAFYAKAQKPTAEEVRRRHPRRDGEPEDTYEGAVKYRTFDVTRGLLPAGSMTNTALHTTIRHANDHLSFLMNHPLAEVRDIGAGWSAMSSERYTSSGTFGAEATVSGVGRDGRQADRAAWLRELWQKRTYEPSAPLLVGAWNFTSDLNLGEKFRTWAEPRFSWKEDAEFWDRRPQGVRLPHEMTNLGTLRWGFLLDFASFRDLQRHRYGVITMPMLTLGQGFEPWYLQELPEDLAAEARELLFLQEKAIREHVTDPLLQQYYIAMGYRVGCYVAVGLPSFAYFAELRSGKAIHPTLRKVVLQMVEDFERTHPEVKLHVDKDPDDWTVRRGGHTITRKDGGSL